MEVKIINGAYGYREKDPKTGIVRVRPVSKGERVNLPDDEAMRLIGLKVAEYAAEPREIPPQAAQGEAGESGESVGTGQKKGPAEGAKSARKRPPAAAEPAPDDLDDDDIVQ